MGLGTLDLGTLDSHRQETVAPVWTVSGQVYQKNVWIYLHPKVVNRGCLKVFARSYLGSRGQLDGVSM
jgi:hypothetical protein